MDLTKKYEYAWNKYSKDDLKDLFDVSERYKEFMSKCKTERECVLELITRAEKAGYKNIEDVIKEKGTLKAGDKVYANNMDKNLALFIIGSKGFEEGLRILGAHVDSPRLDLKQNPLYEDTDLALFETHYYGGIKKYQWLSIPLAIHGVVMRSDGSRITVCIGEKDDDPVFTITDLLPHLGQEQMAKKANEFIKGEDLNVLIGGLPFNKEDISQKYKLAILKLLHDEYQITERDFVSAEIEIVPAFKAKDVGFDRSFIGAYGQDDRVCAFPALVAVTQQEIPSKTCVCILTDKEEIGSDGNTGAQSRLYENFLAEVYAKSSGNYDELGFRKCIANSKMLSADVCNGFDPTYATVSDPKNAAYMSRGICLEKYTGSRGKSGASDANSEFFAEVIRVLDANSIPWQTGELGKVDSGGGGTICKYMANMGMEVLDCGVPVLSMHGPFEITSKIDVYYTYLAYKAFIENV